MSDARSPAGYPRTAPPGYGYPRVAPPPAHIPPAPRPWAAVQHMGVEDTVRLEGGEDDALYQACERLLAEEKARYRRHMVYAWCLIGLCVIHQFVDPGQATAAFIRGLLP